MPITQARAFWLLGLGVLALSLRVPVFAQSCPDEPAPSVASGRPPVDVCIPKGFTEVPLEYFDDYSWRLFVSMIWPAAPGHRGAPDLQKRVSDAGPRVFETFKPIWEVFHGDGSAPVADFNAYDAASHNACNLKPEFGELILGTSPAFGDIGQAGNGELIGPLVAQNGRYVRYQTLYNSLVFDRIVGGKFYLRSALPEVPSPRPKTPVIEFPVGSIAIKAAWVDLTGLSEAQQQRFYRRSAMLVDAATGKCGRATVGLVGLHIIQKTPSRPQWIWTSFEQVDNVPPARMNAPGKFTFHDGGEAAMPEASPLKLVPLEEEPVKPFNVARLPESPIHPRTAFTNLIYERLLNGTVWENYQLVVTQWPRLDGDQSAPVPASQNGDISNTFPGVNATSAFANVTMETFDQARPQLGCMSCHNRARMNADFLWSVADHAYPANLPLAEGAAK